jgi:hypothetical protein
VAGYRFACVRAARWVKESWRLARLWCVITSVLPHARSLRPGGLAVAHVASWRGLVGVLVIMLAVSVARMLAEWSRRRTLVQLVEKSPGGTVVMQGVGRGGPAVWVRVGDGQAGVASGGRT